MSYSKRRLQYYLFSLKLAIKTAVSVEFEKRLQRLKSYLLLRRHTVFWNTVIVQQKKNYPHLTKVKIHRLKWIFVVSSVRLIYSHVTFRQQYLRNKWLGKENFVQPNIQVDSASRVSFSKRIILLEINLREPHSKINAVVQAMKDRY